MQSKRLQPIGCHMDPLVHSYPSVVVTMVYLSMPTKSVVRQPLHSNIFNTAKMEPSLVKY